MMSLLTAVFYWTFLLSPNAELDFDKVLSMYFRELLVIEDIGSQNKNQVHVVKQFDEKKGRVYVITYVLNKGDLSWFNSGFYFKQVGSSYVLSILDNDNEYWLSEGFKPMDKITWDYINSGVLADTSGLQGYTYEAPVFICKSRSIPEKMMYYGDKHPPSKYSLF